MAFKSKYRGIEIERILDRVSNSDINGGISAETDPIFIASPASNITETNIESWNNKVDKVSGKQLSTEDFTTALKEKLSSLSNYDDSALSESISILQSQLNTLVNNNATSAIDTFNEIIAFLSDVEDTENLSGIIASIEQQIAAKQEVIDDLSSIRDGASKGSTAIQPENIADYILANVMAVDTGEQIDDPEI